MDKSQGYVKIFRRVMDSRVWSNEKTFKIFIWCILRANFKDNFVSIKTGRGSTEVEVKRGQFIYGRFSAEEETGINGRTVDRHLEKLEKWDKVSKQSKSHYSIITVVDYDSYQAPEDDRPTNVQPMSKQRPTNVQPLSTNKNVNNVKNDKNKYTITSDENWNGDQPVDYAGFVEAFNKVYNLTGRNKLRITDKKRKQIRGRLRTWTGAEILRAWNNRLDDDWLNGEGSEYLTNWESAMRNDDKIERYQTKRDKNGKQKGINIDKLKKQLEQSKGGDG